MKPNRRACLLTLGALMVGARLAAAQSEQHLQSVDDLRKLAADVGRHKAPLLILFSTPGCPFCREVRRNYLAPRVAEMARNPTPNVLVREVDITSRRSIIDLTGARVSEAELAARFGVRVVPVVMLFDQSMQPLGDPLVGLDRSGFYEGYLGSAIEGARRRLRPSS